MSVALRFTAALLLCTAATAHARPIELASQAGLEATCPPLLAASPKSIARDDERVAFAICSGIALARDAATWWRTEMPLTRWEDPGSRALARARVESYLARIATARGLLERVHARKPIVVVEPGNWAIDFDGDGTVSLHERYFFWTPKPQIGVSPLERAPSEEAYRALYQAPVVNVDPSDVHWALAYCNFAEAALHLVLSYDFAGDPAARVVLVDRHRVRSAAYPRLMAGLRHSGRLRRSLLAETDDDREWIANPRQRQTTFPLAMDEQTFATWGAVLTELQAMLEGKALLGGQVESEAFRGRRDMAFGLCPPGSGLDLRELFMNPLVEPMDERSLAARCVAAGARKPMSGLAALVGASVRRNLGAAPGASSGEWQVLRHLYWVN